MTGIKQARIRACHGCEYRYTRHAKYMDWPHCDGWPAAGDLELDNEFMEGPDDNCPRGKWAHLAPVDMKGEAAAALARAIERETARWKVLLDILSPDEKTVESIRPKIDKLVTDGIIKHPETAEALEAYINER